jgi:ABC-type amino acid transport substrate-binding protein
MAHRLARDLHVAVEFVAVDFDSLDRALENSQCEIAMSGIAVTPLRMARHPFSVPYMDETMAFIVRDHLRNSFTTWDSIRALGPVTIRMPNVPYFIEAIRARLPRARLEPLELTSNAASELANSEVLLMPAERGSVLTMLNPKFSVVVPEPGLIKVPLGYAVGRMHPDWLHFVDGWIELKRKDNTIASLYEHWILGRSADRRQPRWSVVRNVLHWVE